MGLIIDGKEIAQKLQSDLVSRFRSLGRVIRICEIAFGQHEESSIYSRTRKKIAASLGVQMNSMNIPDDADQKYAEERINELAESSYDALFLSMPVPHNISADRLISMIPYSKDMEGLGSENMAMLMHGINSVFPATAKAIAYIVEVLGVSKGSEICIINRSRIIGRPLAMALINMDYTVTVCHSRTLDLKRISREADVVVTATGKAGFLTREYVSEKSTVIDASIVSDGGRITGDASPDLKDFVARITPVPGGVGPVTNVMAFTNLYELVSGKRL
ncbi:MAG: bifunctional 5,10-methylenetetrahydrofolate dehydrogenase/5,10-methenyltetrahydrofolate cyclohydrolase [Candidatus Thermoplasmatota archaeon]|nr:bifunctional 5,10-methylenetetrahydrofolate dehydrogenase/5,10-methenyltetrahydrofolate cyclohydrolase [Candidatus Thermoplasmatota archaeon]